MKKIISLILCAVVAFTTLCIPASALPYFSDNIFDIDGDEIYANDEFYELLGLIRAGSEQVDLTETVKLEKQVPEKIVGADTPIKFTRYKFKIAKKDKLTFNIETTKNYISSLTAVFILNDDHEEYYRGGFERNTQYKTTKFSDSVTLPKGNYYLYIASKGYKNGTFDLKLSAPKNKETKPDFKLKALDGCKVKISWSAVPNATKYRVYKYSAGKFKKIATTTKKSYTVKNLTNGNSYSYVVTAYVNGKWTTLSQKDVQKITARKEVE